MNNITGRHVTVLLLSIDEESIDLDLELWTPSVDYKLEKRRLK